MSVVRQDSKLLGDVDSLHCVVGASPHGVRRIVCHCCVRRLLVATFVSEDRLRLKTLLRSKTFVASKKDKLRPKTSFCSERFFSSPQVDQDVVATPPQISPQPNDIEKVLMEGGLGEYSKCSTTLIRSR